MTIDMKNFAGDVMDSAAEGQSIGTNSYQRETQFDEVPVYKEFLEEPYHQPELMPEEVIHDEPSKQELNFKALREEVERLKSEREAERLEFRQNLDLLRSNTQPPIPVKEPKKFLDELGDNDVPSVAEIRKALEQREAQYESKIEELQVAQTYPDYGEVIEKYLAPLIRQKPHLAEGIHGARNKALYAYELGKMWQNQHQAAPQAPTQTSVNAQRMVDNARKPSTLAQAGGQSVLSKADYYATMSDQEFIKMASRNLGEI